MKKSIWAIIVRNKKILLVREKENWVLPGGKPKKDESDLECLSREIKEELSGSKLEGVKYYGVFKENDKKNNEGLETKVYFAKINKKNPKPSSEISECDWVSLPTRYNLSNITSKILNSLLKKDYLNLRYS